MLIHFGQSSYYKANKAVDRYFLENYLLPGLARQAEIAAGSKGIELPVGENQEIEYISLEEGKALVLDWLSQNNNLLESDKKKLERLKNYQQFANLAGNIYQTQVQDTSKLVTAARLQNVADLRAKKLAGATNTTPHFDPGKVIDDYNKLYLKVLNSSRSGIPHDLLQQITSAGIPSDVGELRTGALAAVISANLSRLYAAGSVGTSPEAQNIAVANELGEIIKNSYPQMTGLLNIIGDPQTASSLREVTRRLAKDLEETTSLAEYEKTQSAAIAATDNYLLNQTELSEKIASSFPAMSPTDRANLTKAILAEIVSSSARPLTSDEIIESVSQKLKIAPEQIPVIQSALRDSGASVSLEYRQNELSLMARSRHLTAGERNLLNKGINPFLTHKSPENLAAIESRLLSEYNAMSGHDKRFASLREAYQNELTSTSPNFGFIERTRSHFNQTGAYDNLSLADRALVDRTRFGRWVTDTRSRVYETQAKFFDKWVDIEDTITGKKWLNKQLDNWDKFTEGFTIPGTKIPLFRIVPWITDRFDEWKKVNTLNIVGRTANSRNFIGKTIHWTFKQYELGGFTINGATAQLTTAQWGRIVKWSLAKTGMAGVVKYAGVSASRTATRFLIKLGGKALARLGAKAIGAVLTAATAIGTVLFVAGMIIDVISIGYQFIKKFFTDLQFRKTIIKWSAGISAVFAGFNFAAFGALTAVILGAVFQIIILAVTITLVTIFVVPQIQNNIKNTFRLDSGISELISSILCEDEEGGTEAAAGEEKSSVASCASCLVKYLDQCYGAGQMLSGTRIKSKGISCIIVSIITPDAAAAIEASAVGYNWLQCVGFARAAAICGGKDLPGQAVASDYIRNQTPGYKFVSGAQYCRPGDFGIVDGAVGHIFVVKSNNSGTITGIDANFVDDGVVSDNTPFPSTMVAGCLKSL